MANKKDKLWVFDTWHYFETYAPDLADAERQADKIGAEIGVDLKLADNWREYQEDEITNA